MITCQECDAEFEVIHDNLSEPEFCPFCASKLRYEDLDEDLWEDDGSEPRGC